MAITSQAYRRFSLPVATAGLTVVEKVSRHWRYETDSAGDIVLALVILEVIWYSIQIIQWVVKKIRGKETRVAVKRYEWRSLERERVIKVRRKHAGRKLGEAA